MDWLNLLLDGSIQIQGYDLHVPCPPSASLLLAKPFKIPNLLYEVVLRAIVNDNEGSDPEEGHSQYHDNFRCDVLFKCCINLADF